MSEFPPAGVPRINPVPAGVDRPFWSVMIPVYQRVQWLEQTLRSVVDELPTNEPVQIEIVDDGTHPPELDAIVARVGDPRIAVHHNATRLGMVGNWNTCIERARGIWVHLLHDDDFVGKDFYAEHRKAAERQPQIGFAACGAVQFIGEQYVAWPPLLAQPGIAPDWRTWLINTNRLLAPSVVVRREAYETVGAYHPEIQHAADWEMWMRLASRFPFWFDPAIRACYRKHEGSETTRQMRSGAHIADVKRVLNIVRTYMDTPDVDVLIEKSLQGFAINALTAMVEVLCRGDVLAAMAQFREALALSTTPAVIRHIESGVMGPLDQFCRNVEAAVQQLRTHTCDPSTIAQLREARRTVARQWLELPYESLDLYYRGDLGRIHKLLMDKALAAHTDPADQELLASLQTGSYTPTHLKLVHSLYAPP
jgi:hypothetical protein